MSQVLDGDLWVLADLVAFFSSQHIVLITLIPSTSSIVHSSPWKATPFSTSELGLNVSNVRILTHLVTHRSNPDVSVPFKDGWTVVQMQLQRP